jgi:hypothetical protein
VLLRKDYETLAKERAYFDPFGDFDLIFGAAKQNLKSSRCRSTIRRAPSAASPTGPRKARPDGDEPRIQQRIQTFWIPGSLALLAPRNDDIPGRVQSPLVQPAGPFSLEPKFLGTGSTRSFYFAVQQLFVVDEVIGFSHRSCRVPRQQYRIPAPPAEAE